MGLARQLIENEDDDLKSEIIGTDDLKRFVMDGRVILHGAVGRSSHHYVHERSTDVEISDVEMNFDSEEQNDFWRETVDESVNALLEDMKQEVIGYNKAIYKDLEASYESDNSDEHVDETIRINDYEFDEDGTRGKGNLQFDELDDEAKKKARDWYREASAGDNYFAEPVIEDWKERLSKKGFDDPEIAYSGFWSQGDGASFTCSSIDFKKYYSAFNPLSPDGGGEMGEGDPGAAGAPGGPAA